MMKGLVIRWDHWAVETELSTVFRRIVEDAMLGQERDEAKYGAPDHVGTNPTDTEAEDIQDHGQRDEGEADERQRGLLGA